MGARNYYYEDGGSRAQVLYIAPLRMGGNFSIEDFMTRLYKANAPNQNVRLGVTLQEVISGAEARFQEWEFGPPSSRRGIAAAYKHGAQVHYIEVSADASAWSSVEATLLQIARSYVAKSR